MNSNKKQQPHDDAASQHYLMRIADLLSDDPLLIAVLGPSFQVAAQYDGRKKIVSYTFRPAPAQPIA